MCDVEDLNLLSAMHPDDDVAVALVDSADKVTSAVLAESRPEHSTCLHPCDSAAALYREVIGDVELDATLAERAEECDCSVVQLGAVMFLGEELVSLGDEVVEQLILADGVLLALANPAELLVERNLQSPLESEVVEGAGDVDCFVLTHGGGVCVLWLVSSVQIVHLAPCEVAKRPVLAESVHTDISAPVRVVSPNEFVLLSVNDERLFAAHPICVTNV